MRTSRNGDLHFKQSGHFSVGWLHCARDPPQSLITMLTPEPKGKSGEGCARAKIAPATPSGNSVSRKFRAATSL